MDRKHTVGRPNLVRTYSSAWSIVAAVIVSALIVLSAGPLPFERSGGGDFGEHFTHFPNYAASVGGPPPAISSCAGAESAAPGCRAAATPEIDANWTNLTPFYQNAPSARYDAASTYDGQDGYGLLFGGRSVGKVLADTWSFSNGSWTNQSPILSTSSPSPRYGASMAFDAALGYVVLFGGRNFASPFSDSWEYRGGIWTSLALSGPSPRAYASMVYDPSLRSVVLFGGIDGTSDFNDTWEFNGLGWSNISSGLSPSPVSRYSAGAAFSSSESVIVVFGGYSLASGFLSDTWTFSTSGWKQVSSTRVPEPRSDPQLTPDPFSGTLVLLGGGSPSGSRWGDLWRFTADNWTLQSSSENATLAARSGAVFVPISEPQSPPGSLLLLMGGLLNRSRVSNETWVYGAALPLGVTSPRASRGWVDQGQPVSFSVHAFGGTPPYSFAWRGFTGTGCVPGDLSNIVCSPTNVTMNQTLEISVVLGDASSSRALSSQVSVLVSPLPVIRTFLLTPTIVPANSSLTFLVQYAGGAGRMTFHYAGLPPGCTSENASAWSCQPTTPGVFSVTASVTDVLNSSDAQTRFVTVTGAAAPAAGPTLVDVALLAVAAVLLIAAVLYWFRGPRRPGAVSAEPVAPPPPDGPAVSGTEPPVSPRRLLDR